MFLLFFLRSILRLGFQEAGSCHVIVGASLHWWSSRRHWKRPEARNHLKNMSNFFSGSKHWHFKGNFTCGLIGVEFMNLKSSKRSISGIKKIRHIPSPSFFFASFECGFCIQYFLSYVHDESDIEKMYEDVPCYPVGIIPIGKKYHSPKREALQSKSWAPTSLFCMFLWGK